MVFISALEGKGQSFLMRQVISTYEKWCSRLSTARLNRWLRKVLYKHCVLFFSPYHVLHFDPEFLKDKKRIRKFEKTETKYGFKFSCYFWLVGKMR